MRKMVAAPASHRQSLVAPDAAPLPIARTSVSKCQSRARASRKPRKERVRKGDVLRVLRGLPASETFDVVIADPPYNIGKDFGNNQDELPLADYVAWSDRWLRACLARLNPGGVCYVYGFPEILAHLATRFPPSHQRWLQWHYTNKAVPTSAFWQRSHESILCLWRSDERRPALEVDQIREPYTSAYLKCIGKERRATPCRYNGNGKRTVYQGHANGALPRDVIHVPALAGGAGRKERWFLCRTCGSALYPPAALSAHQGHDVLKHPTQKPMELSRRLILSRIPQGKRGRVLIPFAGSGSECVVAQALGLDFLGIDINPEYVKFARLWLKETG